MAEKQAVAVETAYEEEIVGQVRLDRSVPDDERVTVKPDAKGGYTVEKFGASTHFTREQWANLLDAVDEADAQSEEKTEAPVKSETPKSETTSTGVKSGK